MLCKITKMKSYQPVSSMRILWNNIIIEYPAGDENNYDYVNIFTDEQEAGMSIPIDGLDQVISALQTVSVLAKEGE